jgi:hypothetical protein
MAYIGNEPGVTNFIFGVDRFNGSGACTQFTLTRTIDDANTVEVLVNSIQQDPINSYSVSGGVITFTEAPSSGANNIVVFYRATSVISLTNVTTAQINDGAVTSSKLASGVLPTAHANAAFNTANASFNTANAAFTTANAAVAVNTTQNNSITAAFAAANAATATDTTQNNSITAAFAAANAAIAVNTTQNNSITAAFAAANAATATDTTQNNSITAAFSAANNASKVLQSGSSKTTSYTLATSDLGQFVEIGTGGSITIPDATFATGDILSLFNNTSGDITITCTITTAYIGGTDEDKATVTLATRGVATILFISGTVCVISGNVT